MREQFDLDRLRDRQKDIREIENVVTDTNQMFRTLSTIVSEQGETVTNIESHIEQVGQHVTEGALELHRARNYHVSKIKNGVS